MINSRIIEMLENFKYQISLFCHSLEKGNPDSSNSSLDSRLRGNDRVGYSTKNLQPIPSPLPLQPTPYNLPPNSGFVMLFSVLVSSLLVAIGLSIFNLTLKEITLSTAGRESQIAFYAANSGLECALYWDVQKEAFAKNNSIAEKTRSEGIVAKCNGIRVNKNNENSTTINSSSDSATTNFQFNITSETNPPCAKVTVRKYVDTKNSNKPTIEIKSQGNNICITGGRRVQRGLQATYTR